MKIMAFSDLHLSRPHAEALVAASDDADLVIAAGDFCNMRQGLAEAMDMLQGITKPMVIIPGNAESAEELAPFETDHITLLHGTGVTIDGLRLFGLGYGIPPTPFGEWSCDMRESDAEALLATCETADILITHSPPKGFGDVTSDGRSLGSAVIAEAIQRIRPQLAMYGHIHDSWGFRGQIDTTIVVNLGPDPNWFNVKLL